MINSVFDKYEFTYLRLVEVNQFYTVICHQDEFEATYYILKMKGSRLTLNLTLDVCLIKNSLEEVLYSSVSEAAYLEVFKVL
jgi:hypothetical protein